MFATSLLMSPILYVFLRYYAGFFVKCREFSIVQVDRYIIFWKKSTIANIWVFLQYAVQCATHKPTQCTHIWVQPLTHPAHPTHSRRNPLVCCGSICLPCSWHIGPLIDRYRWGRPVYTLPYFMVVCTHHRHINIGDSQVCLSSFTNRFP